MSVIQSRIILGIDPGYDRVGWAVGQNGAGRSLPSLLSQQEKVVAKKATSKSTSRDFQLLDCGCIQTSKKDSIFNRYWQILYELKRLINTHHPTYAAIESVFFEHNQKTAMRVAEARGVIIGQLLQSEVKVTEYTPLQMKLAVTGYGQADKVAVRKMVLLQVPVLRELIEQNIPVLDTKKSKTKISNVGMPDDIIDAVGLCLTLSLFLRDDQFT